MMNEQANRLFDEARAYYEKGEYDKSLPLYLAAAEAGNVDALLYAGHQYYMGEGVDEDLHKAIALFNEARERGNKKASAYLAMIQYESEIGSYSDDELYALLKEGFDAGLRRPSYYLARANCYGAFGREVNTMLAAYYATRGVQAGFNFNYVILGELYFYGRYLPENFAWAKYCFQRFEKVYDGFDPSEYEKNAQYCKVEPIEPILPTFDDDAPDFFDRPCPDHLFRDALDMLFDETRRSDPAVGKEKLEMAIRYGCAKAYPSYAARLLGAPIYGEYAVDKDGYVSFKPDPERALALYEKGASLGEPSCYHALGVWYGLGGDGLAPDPEKAAHYLELAVKSAAIVAAERYLEHINKKLAKMRSQTAVSHTCPLCKRKATLILNEREYAEYKQALEDDDLPDGIGGLTLFEKEFFVTGMCPECQARVFNKALPALGGRWTVE